MSENAPAPQEEKVVAIQDNRPLNAGDMKAHVQAIQQVMRSVMRNGTHYGIIPGCQEKSLYKAGSEVLLTTFRISVQPDVEELSDGEEIRYRVTAKGIHQTTGTVVGYGVGECSTGEEKYKWRNAVCDQEFDNTPETHRRIKYGRKGQNVWSRKQVRTNPADMANTVLKMAKKRAQIDLTLTATAASDIFAQDLEDMPEEYVNSNVTPGASQAQQQPTISDAQAKELRDLAREAGIENPDAYICKKGSVYSVEDLQVARFEPCKNHLVSLKAQNQEKQQSEGE